MFVVLRELKIARKGYVFQCSKMDTFEKRENESFNIFFKEQDEIFLGKVTIALSFVVVQRKSKENWSN